MVKYFCHLEPVAELALVAAAVVAGARARRPQEEELTTLGWPRRLRRLQFH